MHFVLSWNIWWHDLHKYGTGCNVDHNDLHIIEWPGGHLNIKMSSYQYRDPHCDRLIFNMGIHIPWKDSLYIETGPRSQWVNRRNNGPISSHLLVTFFFICFIAIGPEMAPWILGRACHLSLIPLAGGTQGLWFNMPTYSYNWGNMFQNYALGTSVCMHFVTEWNMWCNILRKIVTNSLEIKYFLD